MNATRILLWLAALTLLVACDEEDNTNPVTGSDIQVDGDSDVTGGVDTFTSGEDTSTSSDTSRPRDTRVATDTALPDTVTPPLPDPTGRESAACDTAQRVAECPSPLLNDGASAPTDPADLLFYVNRWNPVPQDYPISATSTWTPCDGGTAPGGVSHDLVCFPQSYNIPGRRSALREIAWSSAAPGDVTTTWDGLPVGYNGQVGFQAMIDAAEAEAGHDLFILSGFRAYAYQANLFANRTQSYINQGFSQAEAELRASLSVARPGQSEHQLGLTADLTYRKPDGTIYSGLEQDMGESAPFGWVYENAHRFGIVLTYDEHKLESTQYVYEPWHFRFVGVEAANAMSQCDLNTEELLNARYDVGPLPQFEGDDLILFDEQTLLAHETLPPGAYLMPGETITKIWRVENSGTTQWRSASLVYVSGDVLDLTPTPVACAHPDDVLEIHAELTAPTSERSYAAVYQLVQGNGNPITPPLNLDFVVSSDPAPTPSYEWVRIDDLSNATGGGDPGADIDAVVLVKSGQSPVYATSVGSYAASPANVNANDPNQLLGAPDAFENYPDVTTCRVDMGFVSLGGGGYITARMGAPIEQGDQLDVLEVGGCSYGTGTAFADAIRLQVSTSSDVNGSWVVVGEGSGPLISTTVPLLP